MNHCQAELVLGRDLCWKQGGADFGQIGLQAAHTAADAGPGQQPQAAAILGQSAAWSPGWSAKRMGLGFNVGMRRAELAPQAAAPTNAATASAACAASRAPYTPPAIGAASPEASCLAPPALQRRWTTLAAITRAAPGRGGGAPL